MCHFFFPFTCKQFTHNPIILLVFYPPEVPKILTISKIHPPIPHLETFIAHFWCPPQSVHHRTICPSMENQKKERESLYQPAAEIMSKSDSTCHIHRQQELQEYCILVSFTLDSCSTNLVLLTKKKVDGYE